MKQFKPLLAFTVEDTSTLSYPLYASVKLDGIRVIVLDGVVYSRSMKPIRSRVVQELFGKEGYNGLDGEILYGEWTAKNVFNLTTQTVMSTELKPEFSKNDLRFAVFDYALPVNCDEYSSRKLVAESIVDLSNDPQLKFVGHRTMNTEAALLAFEDTALTDGFEGVMVRSHNGRYKQGRSTSKEGIIGKLKRFSDDEAVVIGFEEKLTNTNEKLKNELGFSQRSQAQEGMVGADTLGALICECKGIRFTMGSGFDNASRDEVWNNREKYLGKLAKFKYFAVGMKDSFRFPIFQGWRDEDDL